MTDKDIIDGVWRIVDPCRPVANYNYAAIYTKVRDWLAINGCPRYFIQMDNQGNLLIHFYESPLTQSFEFPLFHKGAINRY